MPDTKANDVIEMLRRHYVPENRPIAGLFAPEIASPDGRRRADLIWAPSTSTGGYGIVGHEVKVSRADVLVELKDPAKCDPWAQYCERWWLVVSSPDLVDGLDIPESWGIMAPPSGRRTRSMSILRSAPKLRPVDPAMAFRKLMSWQMYGFESKLNAANSSLRYARSDIERLQQQVREFSLSGSGRADPHALAVGRILAAVRKRISEEALWSTDEQLEPQIVEAIVDAEAVRHAAKILQSHIDSACRDMQRALAPSTYVLADLEKARKRLGVSDA